MPVPSSPVTPAPATTAPEPAATASSQDNKWVPIQVLDGGSRGTPLPPEQSPNFTLRISAVAVDLSRVWWMPEQLTVCRFTSPSRLSGAADLSWVKSDSGATVAFVRLRLPLSDGLGEVRITQAVLPVREGKRWWLSGSSAYASLVFQNKEHPLLLPKAAQARWACWADELPISGVIAAALNGCRKQLSLNLPNEELRDLLKNCGDIMLETQSNVVNP